MAEANNLSTEQLNSLQKVIEGYTNSTLSSIDSNDPFAPITMGTTLNQLLGLVNLNKSTAPLIFSKMDGIETAVLNVVYWKGLNGEGIKDVYRRNQRIMRLYTKLEGATGYRPTSHQ